MRSSRNTSAEPRFQFGWLVAIAIFLSSTIGSLGAVPFTLHFQGHLGADGTAIDGPGEFKFALIDGAGAVVWSNSGIPEGGSEPSAAVMVTIEGGFYAVQLGDESVANMAALTLEALRADDLLLRVWFNDGQASFEQLSPDHVLSSAAFAVTAHHAERADVAESVSDGAIGLSGLEDSLANLISELNDKITELETFKETVEGSLSTTTMVSIDPEDANLLSAGFQRFTSLAEGRWLNGDGARQPLARTQHSAVWTGQEMIVWGGTLPGGISGDGAGLYRPDLDRWSPLSPINVLSDRRQHSAVWTGTEMIVWGGFGFPGYLGDGSRFNPATRIWQAISMLGAPLSRGGHGAVWTGSVMLVWGGRDGDGLIGNGALYDPTTDTWTPLPDVGAPSPRFEHSMVWAGDRLLVWGGKGADGHLLGDGAQLTFSDASPIGWQPIAAAGAPGPRSRHSGVWTGTALLVWGGQGSNLLNDGAAYDPVNDVWTPINDAEAPAPRALQSTVWSGTEMLICGGSTATGPTESAHAYNPDSGNWRSLSSVGGPLARSEASAVWTGEEILMYGGQRNGIALSGLQRLNPQPALHLFRFP